MKEAHLIIGFDGTSLDNVVPPLSNCAKIHLCLENAQTDKSKVQEQVYYSGIGTTEKSYVSRAMAKATGRGAHDRLFDAYIKACDFAAEYQDHDINISLYGFSRGCPIALVLEKLIHKVGLYDFAKEAAVRDQDELLYAEKRKIVEEELYTALYLSDIKPGSEEMQKFREDKSLPATPAFHLFFFDPVTAFSKRKHFDPFNSVVEEELEMHGSKLPRGTKSYSVIFSADEERMWYEPVQLIFPDHYNIDYDAILREGVHCDIGGGYKEHERWADRSGLDMISFMQEKAGVIIHTETAEALFDPSEGPSGRLSPLEKLAKIREKEGYLLGAVTGTISPSGRRVFDTEALSSIEIPGLESC